MTDAKLFDDPPVYGPETINVLLYGPAGAGKTTAAASAPGPIVWINLEGTGAMAYARRVAADRGTVIHEVQMGPKEDPRERLREAVLFAEGQDVGTVVVDTIGKVREQIALAVGGETPTMADWGVTAKAMRDVVRTLRDLKVNVVLIAHEQLTDDEGAVIVQPQIGGKTTAEVCAEMDVVAYCRTVSDDDGRQYLGQLAELKGRRAKDRSGALGDFRALDVSEWLEVFKEALALDTSDLPFTTKGEA